MKFALATPALNNYPAAMAPWEPRAGGPEILRYARKADSLSWDWLTIPEHIVMPTDMKEVMGSRFAEGIAASAVLMGATERIHMLTYILALPYRHPLVLAKQIGTMEFLAGGRFTLGTAVGHLEREFETLGIPFEQRGPMTDEYLKALKEAWTSEHPKFHGDFVKFDNILVEPKPVQKPHPPIFVGGNSPAAMRRAAVHGDGWIPWLVTAEDLPGCIAYMKSLPAYEEKADRFEILVTTTAYKVEDFSHAEKGETEVSSDRDSVLRDIEALQKAGATSVQVMPPKLETFEQCLDWIEWYDQEIIPQFR
ncbi:TIGR03619 family F420-dependent LLM class oxidoreductase [Aromatoleum toluclasticum]|uniref:TIGR03619 family F420-dependent LLM class oxidoreductase n=1 Tax=Aromatoleum toluclasticum TaxID=92003 RepID=UPI001D187339|nr:TIGR03619 family F420-dependent LLM class oxidoreductase [Aromatoleum toluclasticum]MCC4118244.1 TIGR03619 family F420-dependent LLM class oxidoreductase [Aromatoleum toluclasticum]